MHGWPYDIHTYVDVVPPLAAAGYRAIVPYLRGYGTARIGHNVPAEASAPLPKPSSTSTTPNTRNQETAR